MLVLSRKKDESIVINNDITIVVVEIRGDKVRLGVEAPKEVPVHRREVYEAIARGEPLVESGPPAPQTERSVGERSVGERSVGERTSGDCTPVDRSGTAGRSGSAAGLEQAGGHAEDELS